MAVLDYHPGISVTIINHEGHELIEHPEIDQQQIDQNNGVARYLALRTVTSYIVAEDDANFGVKMSIGSPYRMDCSKLGFEVWLDGQLTWTHHCRQPDYKRKGFWEAIEFGIKQGKGRSCTEKPYSFTKIETNDGDTEAARVERQKQCVKKAGVIEIRIFRMNYGKEWGEVKNNAKGFMKKNEAVVNERASKGFLSTSHGTVLGEAAKTKRGLVCFAPKMDGKQFPIAVFRFLYRSEEALMQMGVMGGGLPSWSEEMEGNDGLTAEEMRIVEEEARRSREETMRRLLDGRRGVVKRERGEEQEEERPARRRRVERDATVVDLTDD